MASEKVLSELFGKLAVASPEEREAASTNVSSFLNGSIIEHDVPQDFFDELRKYIKDKKNTVGAVNALHAVSHIASQSGLSPSVEPYIVDLTKDISVKAGEKDKDVRDAASAALVSIASAITPTAIKVFLGALLENLKSTNKWQEKIAILAAITQLVDTAKDQVALRMPELIPILSEEMWDTKVDVKEAATAAIIKCSETVENKDVKPFLPKLIESIADPKKVPETVHTLGATTFVAEVTISTLSVMVPLLSRGLVERETAIKRKAAVIIDNMCKLVDDPQVVAPFIGKLLPALKDRKSVV